MDITYDYYRTFYYVAKYGSFSRAGEVLIKGQPNITKAMNNLEGQLGCKLFVRNSRGVTLTPEGEKLFIHTEIAFRHLQTAENEILSERNLYEGTLTIATTELALYGSVLSALVNFKRDYPNVKVYITNHTSPQALEALKNGLADFAVITVSDKLDKYFSINAIKEFDEILCCKNGAFATDLGIESIKNFPFISLYQGTDTYSFYSKYFFSEGIFTEPDIKVATADQILPLVRNGVGIGFVSEFLAKEHIKNGDIVEIRLNNPPPKRKICLVEDRKRTMNIVASTFTKYLKETV